MPILKKLAEFLDGHHVPYTILAHAPAFTAERVAAAQHVPGREVAKVVIVKAGGRFVMAVLPATRKLDVKKLPFPAARLATEDEFTGLFPSCEVGAMPPFGNLWGLPVHVDESLGRDEEIVFNAGTHVQTVRMKYADFARLVEPVVADYGLRHEVI
jgi:Ala-tRNA(Pro) deacylase